MYFMGFENNCIVQFMFKDRLWGLIEFLATDPEAWVRFPALADFLGSSGSGMGSTQPHEYN
jgi:hypothetical protein